MNDINKLALGKRIKNIRVARKDTLETFAQAIQVETNHTLKTTKSNVSKWEKGSNIPNDITLKAIADLGNSTVEYLLYGSLDEHAHNLLDNLESELNDDISISNAVIPFIVNEVKNALFPIYFKQNFSDVDSLETLFKEQKKEALERWSSPNQIETNILTILSETLSKDIYETMPYLYSDRYKNDVPKINSIEGVTSQSDLKRKYLSTLDNYQKSGIDILRYNDEQMIKQAIDDLQKLIDKSPTMFL